MVVNVNEGLCLSTKENEEVSVCLYPKEVNFRDSALSELAGTCSTVLDE